MQVYLFVALVCLIVIAIFVFQNPAVVVVQFLGWQSPEIQMGIIVLLSVIVGVLLTFMFDTYRFFKIARTIKELKAGNKKLEKKNRELEAKIAVSTGNTEVVTSEENNN